MLGRARRVTVSEAEQSAAPLGQDFRPHNLEREGVASAEVANLLLYGAAAAPVDRRICEQNAYLPLLRKRSVYCAHCAKEFLIDRRVPNCAVLRSVLPRLAKNP